MTTLSPIRSIVLCTIGLLLLSCGRDSAGSGGRNESGTLIPAVEAAQAQYGTLPLTERLSGVVKAKNQVAIYPEVSAPIVGVHVQNGDLVGQGDPIVSLRAASFEERLKQARASHQIALAELRQAEAELKRIQSELRRAQSLAEKNLSSEAELETIATQAESAEADVALAQARVDQAQAQVDERQEELQQTVIRAPVDGTVGNRNAEIGMLVTRNTRLFTLGQLDSIRVEIVLTDRMLNYIEAKQRTDIFADALPSGSIQAQLSRISPFLHPVTHSTEAEIDLSNPDKRLKPGMFVTVDVHYGESEQATKIPLSALYENPTTGGTGVYVAADSLDRFKSQLEGGVESRALTEPVDFQFVPVEVIARGRMDVAVTNVQPDQWVVTIGQNLFAGRKGTARVRPVTWQRIEQLQTLQREDLVQELMNSQQAANTDSAALDHQHATPQ